MMTSIIFKLFYIIIIFPILFPGVTYVRAFESSSAPTCINDKTIEAKQAILTDFSFNLLMKGTLTRARTELNPEYLDLRPRAELNPEYWTPCTPLVSTDGPICH